MTFVEDPLATRMATPRRTPGRPVSNGYVTTVKTLFTGQFPISNRPVDGLTDLRIYPPPSPSLSCLVGRDPCGHGRTATERKNQVYTAPLVPGPSCAVSVRYARTRSFAGAGLHVSCPGLRFGVRIWNIPLQAGESFHRKALEKPATHCEESGGVRRHATGAWRERASHRLGLACWLGLCWGWACGFCVAAGLSAG